MGASRTVSDDRRAITFEQAEGMASLPTQLRPKEISPELRAQLWAIIYPSLMQNVGGHSVFGQWEAILGDMHVYRDHRPLDEFYPSINIQKDELKLRIISRGWESVYGTLEFIIRHPACPADLPTQIDEVLRRCRSAYGVFDGDTIGRVTSDEEAIALTAALKATHGKSFSGAHSHLKSAISALTAGNAAASIRESISAVESAALVIAPGAKTLGPALSVIEKRHHIHGALTEGFKKLYGFTSDEKGIRHALLDKPDAEVDDTDALYMLGACASFVTYLVNRAK
jgi:hypothetical protein